MNYIKQINGFWAKAESLDLSSQEIALYMALLHFDNKINWKSPFICHYHILCQIAKISKNTFYKCMAKLEKNGFIIFNKGEKNKQSPKVTILNIENKKGTMLYQDCEQDSEQYEELTEEQKGNLYKQLNLKTIKLLNLHTELINLNLEFWIKKNYYDDSDSPHKKASKLKNSIRTSSIDRFKNQLQLSAELQEGICNTCKIDKNYYEKLLKLFILECDAIQRNYKSYSDVASHFQFWVKKHKDNYKHLITMKNKPINLDEYDDLPF